MQYQNETEFNQLLEIYRALSKRAVLEIGSMTGETLWAWMTNSRPLQLVSIDLMVPPSDGRRLYQQAGHDLYWPRLARTYGHTFTVINANSRDPETVARVRALTPELDFLFIDGDHSFAGVQADYENYGPLVRSGGVIALHDIGPAEWPETCDFWQRLVAAKVATRMREIRVAKNFGLGVIWKD